MADFPTYLAGSKVSSYGQSGTSGGTNIRESGSADTKGAWIEITASTVEDGLGFILVLGDADNSGDWLIDVGVGAAGSEQVIVSDLLFSKQIGQATTFFFPIPIPVGTRISGRCQHSTTGDNLFASIYVIAGNFLSSFEYGKCTTYGANTADSGGTSIDPGGSVNTKGSWTQVTAATSEEIRYLIITIGNQGNATRADSGFLLDVGVGAGGSEETILSNLALSGDASLDMLHPTHYAFPIEIPVGTRIAVRAQSNITTSPERLFDVAIYGVC